MSPAKLTSVYNDSKNVAWDLKRAYDKEYGYSTFRDSQSAPNIVYVFPDPVCPYANIEKLYPLNTSFKAS